MTTTEAIRRPSGHRSATVTVWVLRIGLAAVFAAGGLAKLGGDAAMVAMFTDIGAGQELRYLVGALELAAAIGLLLPRLAGAAALGLVALMVGATITNVAVLHTSPAVTVVLMLLAAGVARARLGFRERRR